MVEFNAVYYVNDSSYNPLAIRPTFIKVYGGDKRCEWNDTDRGSYLLYQAIVPKGLDTCEGNTPHEFTLTRKEDEVEIRFSLLTLEIFNEKLAHVVAGSPIFSSTEILQEFYLKQSFPSM